MNQARPMANTISFNVKKKQKTNKQANKLVNWNAKGVIIMFSSQTS